MKHIRQFTISAALALAFLVFAPCTKAGPIPATALQYPEFVLGQGIQATNVGSSESNLVQVVIPRGAFLNNGFGNFSALLLGDGTNNTKTFTWYLGGVANGSAVPSNATPFATNTVTTATDTLVSYGLQFRGTNNLFSSWLASVGGVTNVTKNFDNLTNDMLLTITGKGPNANAWFGLDAFTARIVQLP